VTYSDVQGGWSGDGNIDEDPVFLDASRGNHHLLRQSPCIDAGSNVAVPSSVTTDFDGHWRVVDGNRDGNAIVDMGAYEYQTVPPPGDLDGDGDLDYDDYSLMRSAIGRCSGDSAFNSAADFDQDRCVTLMDYQVWIAYYRDFVNDPTAGQPVPDVRGDINGDGAVNGLDIQDFVIGYIDASGGSRGACHACDIDRDGFPDADDVAAFVTSLLEGQRL
jgi:hypothetical protein